MSKINVLLSCNNAEKTIDECVESILNQTYQDFRLLIFDDLSTDNTVNKILNFKDSRITLIKSLKNIGTYASKNFMLKNLVDSEFVALHDADDISILNRFQRQIEELEKDPNISCLGTGVLEFWENNEAPHTISGNKPVGNKRENFYPEKITNSILKEIHEMLLDENQYPEYLKKKLCMNGTVMFRKNILDSLGGWDGNTRIAADTEIFLRSLSLGYIKNINEILYKRRFHANSLTASSKVGIKSIARKNYNMSLSSIVEKTINETVKRDFYYPDFDFEVINCAD